MGNLRLFAAIELPAALQDDLVLAQKELHKLFPESRLTRREGLHITLHFLGSVAEEKLPEVRQIFDESVREIPAFQLELQGWSAFSNWQRPRVVVAQYSTTSALEQLHTNLETGFVPLGVPKDERAFKPHVTLARFKSRPVRQTAPEFPLEVRERILTVDSIALFQSKVGKGGSEYTALQRWPLRP